MWLLKSSIYSILVLNFSQIKRRTQINYKKLARNHTPSRKLFFPTTSKYSISRKAQWMNILSWYFRGSFGCQVMYVHKLLFIILVYFKSLCYCSTFQLRKKKKHESWEIESTACFAHSKIRICGWGFQVLRRFETKKHVLMKGLFCL